MGSAATTDPSTPNRAMKRHYNKVFEGVRDGKKVLLKRCQCGLIGIVSEGPDSDFPVQSNNGNLRPRSLCVSCYRKLRNRQRAERLKDPVYRAAVRRRSLEAHRRWRAADPERHRQVNREWRKQKRKTDPEYFREYARMWWTLNRERQGKKVKRHSTVVDGTRPTIPVELFRAWLLAYQKATGQLSSVVLAEDLLIEERRVRSVLNYEQPNVSQDIVDAALLNARVNVEVDGKPVITLSDLYGEILDDLYGEKQAERTLS